MVDPKQHLRMRLTTARRHVPAALRQRWSQSVVALCYRLFGGAPRGPLGVFLPTAAEPDLAPAYRRWLAAGAQLTIPAHTAGTWTWRRLRRLPTGSATPKALPADSLGEALVPQVALVPGVACDRAGRRLGQGGGIYDRLLAPISLSFICIYPFQLVAKVPTARWDRRVSGIVMPHQIVLTPEIFFSRRDSRGAGNRPT